MDSPRDDATHAWQQYEPSDDEQCPPAPFIVARPLPDVMASYDMFDLFTMHTILSSGTLLYCADADHEDRRFAVTPDSADTLDLETLEGDATWPLIPKMTIRFEGLPGDWDMSLCVREMERGVTVRYVLQALDYTLQLPMDPTIGVESGRRIDLMRELLLQEQWIVTIESRGGEEFVVILV